MCHPSIKVITTFITTIRTFITVNDSFGLIPFKFVKKTTKIMKKNILVLAIIATLFSCTTEEVIIQSGESSYLSESFTRVRVNNSANFTDVSFYDENNGVIGASSGNIIKTSDGGVTWTPMTSEFVTYSSVFMYNPSTVYAGRRAFYKMNGDAMTNIGGLGSFDGAIEDIHFTSQNTGFALKETTIIKTTDGGNSWTVNHGTTDHLDGLVFATPSVAYAWGGDTHDGLSGAVLIKSTDGCQHWNPVPLQTSEIIAMQFLDENTGFLINFNRELLKTTDGGITWSKLGEVPQSPNNGSITSMLYVSDRQIFVTNLDGQLLKSSDGGASWQSIFQLVPGIGFSKIIRVNRTIYVIGDNGYLLKN